MSPTKNIKNKAMNEPKYTGELAKAIIAVMKKVKGIEKTATIGTGSNSYKGVPDQEVKKVVGEAMAEAGLCILPVEVIPTLRIDRWEASYNGTPQQKQQVFTEVKTKYLLMHASGESMELAGYGHGIDTQDKSAGKAMTYALKYALLYVFMVPTGKIDDADAEHSEKHETPPQGKPWLTENMKAFAKAKELIGTGEKTIDDIKHTYQITEDIEQKLLGHKK